MFSCSADHEQDWQPYPVDSYSAESPGHTYKHTHLVRVTLRVVVESINSSLMLRKNQTPSFSLNLLVHTAALLYQCCINAVSTAATTALGSVKVCGWVLFSTCTQRAGSTTAAAGVRSCKYLARPMGSLVKSGAMKCLFQPYHLDIKYSAVTCTYDCYMILAFYWRNGQKMTWQRFRWIFHSLSQY